MILRIKGVKPVRSKGHLYFYHRKSGTRLPGQPGTAEFMDALARLTAPKTAQAAAPGTLGGLVHAYRASPEFTRLAAASRFSYSRIFTDLRGIDDMPLDRVTSDFLYKLRDKKLAQRKRWMANYMLTVLSVVFKWGERRSIVDSNPAAKVEKVRKPRNAPVINRPWTAQELATVLEAAPAWLRVPIALGAYTGLREADLLRIEWGAYDGEAIATVSQKTGIATWVPAHPVLKAILDAAPRQYDRIVVGARGQPISAAGLRGMFYRFTKQLRAEGKVGPGLSFHGLRHTLGTALAEAGADAGTIAAILGHETQAMAQHYSRHANRRALAAEAMRKLSENRTENQPVTD